MESILIASTIVQWVAIIFHLMFTLTLLRVVGANSAPEDLLRTQTDMISLHGVNISSVEVYDARLGASRAMVAVLDGKSALLVVTDPTCSSCEENVTSLLKHDLAIVADAIIAVRGAKQVADRFAADEAMPTRVVGDEPSLGLQAFPIPFATVLARDGSYAGYTRIENNSGNVLAWRTLRNQRARESMYDQRMEPVVNSS